MFLDFGSNIIRGMILFFGTISLLFSLFNFLAVFSFSISDIESGMEYYYYIEWTATALFGIVFLLQGILSFIRKEKSRRIISKTLFISMIIFILYIVHYVTSYEIESYDDLNWTIISFVMIVVFWRIFNDESAIKYFNRITS